MTTAVDASSLESLGLELRGVTLHGLTVHRGEGDSSEPGAVMWDQTIEMGSTEDAVQYRINSQAQFQDANAVSIAELDFSYEVRFAAQLEATVEQLQIFAPSAVLIVTPYQRELITNVNSRLGIPQFVLPLLTSNGFELARDEDSDEK